MSIKFISLVNLIADKEIVKELIQKECTVDQIEIELNKILTNDGRDAILKEYRLVKELLGTKSSSEILSRKILTFSS